MNSQVIEAKIKSAKKELLEFENDRNKLLDDMADAQINDKPFDSRKLSSLAEKIADHRELIIRFEARYQIAIADEEKQSRDSALSAIVKTGEACAKNMRDALEKAITGLFAYFQLLDVRAVEREKYLLAVSRLPGAASNADVVKSLFDNDAFHSSSKNHLEALIGKLNRVSSDCDIDFSEYKNTLQSANEAYKEHFAHKKFQKVEQMQNVEEQIPVPSIQPLIGPEYDLGRLEGDENVALDKYATQPAAEIHSL